ncbi:MAG: GatB/YqeY domain-containing protein [Bdellovibrionales bacterium]
MSLKEQILKDLKEGLKNQDKKLLKALRFLQASIKNKEIEMRPKPLKEEDVLAVLKKQVKQVQESIEGYKQSEEHKAQAEEEEYNLAVLKRYLPEQLSSDQLKTLVEKVIQELKPSSMKEMGSVMKACMEKAKGGADAKLLSQMIRDHLQKL